MITANRTIGPEGVLEAHRESTLPLGKRLDFRFRIGLLHLANISGYLIVKTLFLSLNDQIFVLNIHLYKSSSDTLCLPPLLKKQQHCGLDIENIAAM